MRTYDIYAKDKCLFKSVEETDFDITWNALKRMVGIMKTDYSVDDLYYEENTD